MLARMTAKRVLISIDERLLARIDQRVQRLGMTRSGYLARLAGADLEGHDGAVLGNRGRERREELVAEQ